MQAASSPSDRVKYLISAVVSLALFMEALDMTIINTAIPSMARSLMVNPIDLKVALISYLLSLAIFIPISGWIADKFGAKVVLTSAMGIFTISSLFCGLSNNLGELVIARIVQGCGGALMMPVARLVAIRLFDRSELVVAMNRIIVPSLIGPALGPVLGGLITHYFTWRWIFYVNIPFGIIAMILAWRLIENTKAPNLWPLDKTGFLLFGLSLSAFTFGFSLLSESAIKVSNALLIIFGALVGFGIYFWHSRKLSFPILDTELLKIRTFKLAFLGNLVCRMGLGGIAFLLPLLLQVGLGFSAAASGLMIFPTAIGAMCAKFIVKRLLHQLGYRRFLLSNTVALGLSLWSFILIVSGTAYWLILIICFIYGVLVSCQYSCMNPLAYADVIPEKLSNASSMMNVVQQISVSIGVASCALLLKLFSGFSQTNALLTVYDFQRTFFAAGCVTVLSVIIFSFLRKDDGRAVYQ